MKPSIKRLAKDHVKLRRDLPPCYFFESEADFDVPDDLTQLSICLTGPDGTPFTEGYWRLRLNIPTEYPQKPPTASFLTKIFHPNVAEDTGAVCLETLKRDWDPNLTLRDILVHISCLLIQPNPDSALNQKAGVLIQDDYQAFSKQARLMTRIHARIPTILQQVAEEARRRGDDELQSVEPVLQETQQPANIADVRLGAVVLEKSRKRPLQDDDLRGYRRKSPKHHHPASAAKTEVITAQSNESLNSNVPRLPTKLVFRAQWAVPGLIKTRTGLRRL